MTIQLVNPTSYVEKAKRQKEHKLHILKGKRVGYIFNQHGSALAFWKAFEKEVERELNPSGVSRIYKESTWKPAPQSEVKQLVLETDFALVGVGA